MLTAVCFWAFGYALAYGEFIQFMGGERHWLWFGMEKVLYTDWWVRYAYTATSVAIALGALAERTNMIAYMIFTFFWACMFYRSSLLCDFNQLFTINFSLFLEIYS